VASCRKTLNTACDLRQAVVRRAPIDDRISNEKTAFAIAVKDGASSSARL